MKRATPLIVLAALAAAALACSTSITVNLPRITTGATQTFTLSEPLPRGEVTTHVTLRMGAGNFTLTGGADGLAGGVIRYNVPEWKPTVTRGENRLTVQQGSGAGFSGLPGSDVLNDWDLKLGDTPLDLTIEAGAYRGKLDLGGLRLRHLRIADGASDSQVSFNSANPEQMDELLYETGASRVNLSGLSNANFAELVFKGGAGDYTLDFSGQLQRDATVKISAGICSIKIILPAGVPANITVTGGINNITTQGTWTTNGNNYTTAGPGPGLTFQIEMGVGSLSLISQYGADLMSDDLDFDTVQPQIPSAIGGWPGPHNRSRVAGIVLIVLGAIFLLQNAGLVIPGNWWALFILIPAAGSFVRAWNNYQAAGNLSGAVRGPLVGGLMLTAVALIFLFDLDWGQLWPVFLIIAGAGALLSGLGR